MKMPWVRYCSTLLYLFVITFFLLPVIPSFSAGYQEEKLFDNNFYSAEELRQKVERHKKEIVGIDRQIKQLEIEIDWLVLKINQIQDSSRQAPSALKESISEKEKKIATLSKTRARLQHLVQYYTGMLNNGNQQELGKTQEKYQGSVGQADPSPPLKQQPVILSNNKRVESLPEFCQKQVGPKAAGMQQTTFSKLELENAVQQAGLIDWVEVIDEGSCLRMKTTLPILFSTGSAKVSAEYNEFLEKLARFLKSYDVKVLVNGYADKVPIKNEKYPSNFELAATRAANIVHQFVEYGLKPSIFKIESSGEHRFASKKMSNQKSLERRAEVTVIFSG